MKLESRDRRLLDEMIDEELDIASQELEANDHSDHLYWLTRQAHLKELRSKLEVIYALI